MNFTLLCLDHVLSRITHIQLVVTPGSSVPRILQARILEWVAVPYSKGPSQPREQTHISHVSFIGRWIFTTSTTWEALVLITAEHKRECASEFLKPQRKAWVVCRGLLLPVVKTLHCCGGEPSTDHPVE